LPAAQYKAPLPFVTGLFAWAVVPQNLTTSIHNNFFRG
jgi:hypothetical protein